MNGLVRFLFILSLVTVIIGLKDEQAEARSSEESDVEPTYSYDYYTYDYLDYTPTEVETKKKKTKPHGKHRKRIPAHRKNRTRTKLNDSSLLDFEINLAPLIGGEPLVINLPLIQSLLNNFIDDIDLKKSYEIIMANEDNCTISDLTDLALGDSASLVMMAAPMLEDLHGGFVKSMEKAFVKMPNLFKSYDEIIYNANQTIAELTEAVTKIYRKNRQTTYALIGMSVVNFYKSNQHFIQSMISYLQDYAKEHPELQ